MDLQNLFALVSEEDGHRRQYYFKTPFARTTLKQMCLSIYGVKLWNTLDYELKCYKNVCKFKNLCKKKIQECYKENEDN